MSSPINPTSVRDIHADERYEKTPGFVETAELELPKYPKDANLEASPLGDVIDPNISFQETHSTVRDAKDMHRMGRRQQLVRNFRLISTIAFTAVATAGWELTLVSVNQPLIDGGRPSLVWSFIWNWFAFFPVTLSLSEMASMAPIAGAQYHWVSEFAPDHLQKYLSYLSGWIETLAWQAGNALGCFAVGTLIQTLILINNANYAFPNYQGTLLVIGSTVLTYLMNVFGNRLIPYIQNPILALSILMYFCFLLPPFILAPQATPSQVFTDWSNTGGWSSMGLAVLVGQLSGMSAMTGMDSAAHMSEEVRDASRNVPLAIMGAYVLNGVLNIPIVIMMAFALPDVDAAFNDASGYVIVYILRQSMSVGWVTAAIAVLIIFLQFSNMSYLAAVSRDLFAFARDGGVPFSGWFQRVHPRRHIPMNAILASSIFSVLCSLIYIGSPIALYAILSVCLVAFLQCYLVSISCILWRRIYHPETLPPRYFDLGRFGVAINAWSVLYSAWAFFWAFWPQTIAVDAADFNWASPLFGGTVVLALFLWIFQRKKYRGPVSLVEGRKEHFT